MQTVKVSAQRGVNEPPVEVEFSIGENIDELKSQFGDEIVYSHAKRSVIIALQGYMRSLMDQGREKGQSAADIATTIIGAVDTWKPSQKKAPKSTQDKARDMLARMTPAERQAVFNEYRKKAKEEAAAA